MTTTDNPEAYHCNHDEVAHTKKEEMVGRESSSRGALSTLMIGIVIGIEHSHMWRGSSILAIEDHKHDYRAVPLDSLHHRNADLCEDIDWEDNYS